MDHFFGRTTNIRISRAALGSVKSRKKDSLHEGHDERKEAVTYEGQNKIHFMEWEKPHR